MGYPELSSTLDRPARSRRSRAAPHQHGPTPRDGPTDGPDATLVALSLAVQDGCAACVEHHAAAAGAMAVPRLRVLEALGTALLLTMPKAGRWPRLAEAALTAHEHGS